MSCVAKLEVGSSGLGLDSNRNSRIEEEMNHIFLILLLRCNVCSERCYSCL